MPQRHNNPTRRQFLRSLSGRPPVQPPPWTGADLTALCSRCDACIDACPERVLRRGDGGFPEVSFVAGGCSLCGYCIVACPEAVFDTRRVAFPWHAWVTSNCLALAQIHCQTCQDACEWGAIRFPPALGRPPQPVIDSDACCGCGACLATCPNGAVALSHQGAPSAGTPP